VHSKPIEENINPQRKNFFVIIFIVAPFILMLSSLSLYPTDAQLDCSKRMS